MAFLVKGGREENAVVVNRDAVETRPLNMKICIKKVFMFATCNALNSEYI